MAKLTVTNISAEPQPCSDLFRTLAVGETFTMERAPRDIEGMASLRRLTFQNLVTVAIEFSDEERMWAEFTRIPEGGKDAKKDDDEQERQ